MFKLLYIPLITVLFATPSFAADTDAAKDFAKQKGCFTCHAIEKLKVGPAWNSVAEKYKSNPGAKDEIFEKLTKTGITSSHLVLNSEDPDKVKNLVEFIFSLSAQ